jgi:acetyl-CoA synthetase
MTDAENRIDTITARGSRAPEAQDAAWQALLRETPVGVIGALTFDRHRSLYHRVFDGRPAEAPPPALYLPSREAIANANVTKLAEKRGLPSFERLHAWSVAEREAFWETVIEELRIPLRLKPARVLKGGPEDPQWLLGARMNIADACFQVKDPQKAAIVWGREGEAGVRRVSYEQLEALVDRVAHGFRNLGLQPGDAVALYLPMTVECVAAYLGIVRAGGVVVSIADSFAPPEVATRLKLGNAKAIVTTASFARGGKTFDLYAKVREASGPRAIVIGAAELARESDVRWDDFLGSDMKFAGPEAAPDGVTNILFSSGTTGEPKAIPWTHLTPIKAAVDGRYHQDIHESDVVAWPTSIGWMMGPWLVYASLMNGATMALYEGAPNSPDFPAFVDLAGVTVLGVVPALVRSWRAADCVGKHFSRVRIFSSTGEASNVEDYQWLMATAGYRAPVIEYCGGTEIGGGHLTGTVVQPQSPATFSTPALGLDVVILDDHGKSVGENEMGELFVVPPSIGLSQKLVNRDHHKEYYEGAPRGPKGELLRRHGDEVARLPGGYFQAHGRADDTMNLGGIKVSSLELERVMDRHPAVYQSAAVAVVPPEGGADLLVAFVVPEPSEKPDAKTLRDELQARLKNELNPLYRIHEVRLVDALPRTASNKIMRRELRKSYQG